MGKAKVAITMDEALLRKLDELVRQGAFANRSQAIEAAVREKIQRLEGTRLARECARLDPRFEQAMADDGLAQDLDSWPEY